MYCWENKKQRRKGVGTALLNHAFEILEYTVWSVEAFSNNQAAIRLYEKNGFKVVQSKKLSFMHLLGAGYPIRLRKRKNVHGAEFS